MKLRLLIPAGLVLCFVYFIMLPAGCKKVVDTTPPAITIDSARATGLSSFQASVSIDLGEGNKIVGAKVIFDDITLLTAPDIEIEIALSGDRYQDKTVEMQIDELNHDFAVSAVIETESGQFASEIIIARTVKNTFRPYMLIDNFYSFKPDNIANCYNKGDRFIIWIDYDTQFDPGTVEVRLNKSIPVEIYIDFYVDIVWSGEGLSTLGGALVPEDIEAGVYSVDVYIEGHEFSCAEKIKVTDGSWSIVDSLYPGEERGYYATFLLGDEVYAVGGLLFVLSFYSPVWKYNLSNKSWTHLADFPHPGDPSFCEIYSYNLVYNDTGYVVSRYNDDAMIWKYNPGNDSWLKITDYPGDGRGSCIGFIYGSKIYLGGGKINNQYKHDFWSYDLNTGLWTRENDIPFYNTGSTHSSCCIGGSAFMFNSTGFQEFEIATGTWKELIDFPGLDRSGAAVIAQGEKIYVIGGMHSDNGYIGLKDCWEYNVPDKSWEIRAFMPDYYGNGIKFLYNGKVHVGIGYVSSSYWTYYSTSIYQFNL